MHYLLFYDVVDDYAERRPAHRIEHLELAEQSVARGELLLAGALSEPMDGAVFLFQGDSPRAAAAFAEADPYVRHGLVTRARAKVADGGRAGGGDAGVVGIAARGPDRHALAERGLVRHAGP